MSWLKTCLNHYFHIYERLEANAFVKTKSYKQWDLYYDYFYSMALAKMYSIFTSDSIF